MRKKIRFLVCFICLLVPTMLATPSSVNGCRAPLPSPQKLVADADIIIRATATQYARAPVGNIRQLNEPGDAEIQFQIEETLKGRKLPLTIVLNGYLTARDDFNDRPVPYDFVRPGGRGGSCSAYEYKQGAEFLLFLKEVDGRQTVRWYALAPTNEQLHSADDPWLSWVKEQLKQSEWKVSTFGRAGEFARLLVSLLQILSCV